MSEPTLAQLAQALAPIRHEPDVAAWFHDYERTAWIAETQRATSLSSRRAFGENARPRVTRRPNPRTGLTRPVSCACPRDRHNP